MTTRRRSVTYVAAGAAVAAVILTAAVACSGGGEPGSTTTSPTPTRSSTATPTSSPVPSPSETPDATQLRIDDAKATYTEYTAAFNKAQQAGGGTWMEDVVAPFTSGDMRPRMVSYFEQFVAQGLRQTGASRIAALTAVEATEQTVVLEACLDNTDVDVVDPNGASVMLEGFPARLITVETLRVQADGRWTLVDSKTDQERQC